MPNQFTFTTDDPALAQKIAALMGVGSASGQSVAAQAAVNTLQQMASQPAAQLAPVEPPKPAAQPPAPPPAPVVPAAVAAPANQPNGWTIDHVRTALTQMAAKYAGNEGPQKVMELLTRYSTAQPPVPDLTTVDPAQWPNLYKEATEG